LRDSGRRRTIVAQALIERVQLGEPQLELGQLLKDGAVGNHALDRLLVLELTELALHLTNRV